ncbi:5-oxoprolinase subunit PxpB [Sulfobacillus harzensis]|uniref:5-oxoprolinase subunit PxpB n=1 Tax=Sulfobacillus harzensis TaxID=2729629 RepID=A0A7Y0L5W1_9FIRM|nr:5-oxoprolinase subunit PxpB [Sulfobacillus harzensis]NMP23785.1 5-oxoprolinase subunit PxpB [Sulfobacillus harzensis]
MAHHPRMRLAGDAAILLEFGQTPDPAINRDVHRTARALQRASIAGVWGIVPAYTTLLVEFDPFIIRAAALMERIQNLALDDVVEAPRCFEIPTAYGGPFGEDLADAATRLGLDPEELVAQHSKHRYQIYCLGFSPGFPLAGILPEALRLPRRTSPRTAVPSGAVAIAGFQTGVYPTESPGGWHLIGRTPGRLFHLERTSPVMYQPGDYLQFRPISGEEYRHLEARALAGEMVVREVANGPH